MLVLLAVVELAVRVAILQYLAVMVLLILDQVDQGQPLP
jgi:hypothetical protein